MPEEVLAAGPAPRKTIHVDCGAHGRYRVTVPYDAELRTVCEEESRHTYLRVRACVGGPELAVFTNVQSWHQLGPVDVEQKRREPERLRIDEAKTQSEWVGIH